MMKVYVCEDNVEQRENLTQCISEIIEVENYDFEVGASTGDPRVLLDSIRDEKQVGIFFLDIDLNTDINGIELASEIRKLQPRCYIIFVTTHSEMSYMTFSYKVEAMDFIIKDNIRELKNRVHQCLINCYQLSDQQSDEVATNYMVKMGDRVKAVPYSDILYFEVEKNSRKITLCAKNCKLQFVGKMKDIENDLDQRFVRCHRSYLVNKENVIAVDKEESYVTLTGGVTCPISVRMGKALI